MIYYLYIRTFCAYEFRQHNHHTRVAFAVVVVVMSVTFVVVLMLLQLSAQTELVDDENIYSRAVDVPGAAAAREAWAEEALSDVAFYLRLHKFNDFDRR